MDKWEDKITRAAHIKKHTRGTSNEISFSVLDAAKNALDGDANDKQKHAPFSGRISLFTLPGRRKKPAGTPTKERGLPLSTGDFVSVEDSGPVPKLNTMSPPRTVGARCGPIYRHRAGKAETFPRKKSPAARRAAA